MKPFSSAEAKALLTEHEELINRLNSVSEMALNFKAEIKRIRNNIVNIETRKVLYKVPVEELKKYKSGLKTKILVDNGFYSVSDILISPAEKIASIKGISINTALLIKDIAQNIEASTEPTVTIKPDPDNQTRSSSNLVLSILKYTRALQLEEKCSRLKNENESDINHSVENLRKADNGLKWLLASKTKKEEATQAYSFLSDSIVGSYGSEAKGLIHQIDVIKSLSSSDAWKEYISDPSPFLKIINSEKEKRENDYSSSTDLEKSFGAILKGCKPDINLLESVLGCSVTSRINQIKQPYGGYIPRKSMETFSLGEGIEVLEQDENIAPALVGTTVDYLTRYMLGTPAEDAFHISMLGAEIIGEKAKAKRLISSIKGLDQESVINAVKLTGFDVIYRVDPTCYKSVEDINPNNATIKNIVTMVKRALAFFDRYGPIVLDGFTFEGGYTRIVSSGDGDFTTADTLWDFKVSKSPVKKEQTLQLLMYWRMGLHSIHPEFKEIRFLGIYNPRLNTVNRIAVKDIHAETIKEVDTEVIGYGS